MLDALDLYNEDELVAPDWMDEDFFKIVLQQKEKVDDVEILRLAITPGTTKSDHYASIMFRAKVSYSVSATDSTREEKFQSMIVKTMPMQEGPKRDTLNEMTHFETEIKMYTEMLPQIESILRNYGDDTKLCTNCLYYSTQPRKCVIFEDLIEEGYTAITNRWPTITEVKESLRRVAKLHAVSYKMLKENSICATQYRNGLFSSIKIDEFEITKNATKLFKEILKQNSDLLQYVPYVESLERNIFPTITGFFNAYNSGERGGIFVLNHGDFHMKNMMLKSVDGQLQDLMLIDYQFSFVGSVAMDLLYAFTMLLSPEMRRDNREELLGFYFSNFQTTLKNIKYVGNIPTTEEFENELQKHRHWEVFMVISFLVLNYVFADAEGDLGKAVEDESYRRRISTSPKFMNEVRNLLSQFLEKGYFENA